MPHANHVLFHEFIGQNVEGHVEEDENHQTHEGANAFFKKEFLGYDHAGGNFIECSENEEQKNKHHRKANKIHDEPKCALHNSTPPEIILPPRLARLRLGVAPLSFAYTACVLRVSPRTSPGSIKKQTLDISRWHF
ncbi:MAG: hypothetical protein LBM17_08145 [Candidatus Accumulibacter sp.]|nr:hypothetical protein [Accumulibacter sp.]